MITNWLNELPPSILPNKTIYGDFLVFHGEIAIQSPDKNFTNIFLAIESFKKSRKFLKKHSLNYGESLVNEGTGISTLAKNGIDSINNYKKSIKLFKRVRNECAKNDEMMISYSLINEGISRLELAMIGENPIWHLNASICLFKEASESI